MSSRALHGPNRLRLGWDHVWDQIINHLGLRLDCGDGIHQFLAGLNASRDDFFECNDLCQRNCLSRLNLSDFRCGFVLLGTHGPKVGGEFCLSSHNVVQFLFHPAKGGYCFTINPDLLPKLL